MIMFKCTVEKKVSRCKHALEGSGYIPEVGRLKRRILYISVTLFTGKSAVSLSRKTPFL
jgi:hypothetical protein